MTKVTPKQAQILQHLYAFRFLTRNQIQQLMNHKHFNRIIVWLNYMTDTKLVRKYYDPKLVTKPAMYSLGTKGRKYLLSLDDNTIDSDQLDRVWREHKSSPQFKTHCQFIADCFLALRDRYDDTHFSLYFFTKTQLHKYHQLIHPLPDAYFAIKDPEGHMHRYFLDVFDDMPPRMMLRKRVKQYLEYYEDEIWVEIDDRPFPKIMLILPEERSMKYVIRFVKRYHDWDEPVFSVSTRELVKKYGISNQSMTIIEIDE